MDQTKLSVNVGDVKITALPFQLLSREAARQASFFFLH